MWPFVTVGASALVIFVDKELKHIIPVEPMMLGLRGVSEYELCYRSCIEMMIAVCN